MKKLIKRDKSDVVYLEDLLEHDSAHDALIAMQAEGYVYLVISINAGSHMLSTLTTSGRLGLKECTDHTFNTIAELMDAAYENNSDCIFYVFNDVFEFAEEVVKQGWK
jgi:hypothetical protein